MKKKVISDIRLYKSWILSESGTDITTSFGDKKLNAITRRIAMKLRESEFSLGDFDHLYINFTTYDLDKEMNLSTKVDRYHPWYRYCNIPVEKDFHNILGSPQSYEGIVHWIATALITYFSTEDFDQSRILAGVQQAVEQGEQMLMKFKEIFPNSDYIDISDCGSNFDVPSRFNYVVIYTRVVTHSHCKRIESQVDREKILLINICNKDLVIDELYKRIIGHK